MLPQRHSGLAENEQDKIAIARKNDEISGERLLLGSDEG